MASDPTDPKVIEFTRLLEQTAWSDLAKWPHLEDFPELDNDVLEIRSIKHQFNTADKFMGTHPTTLGWEIAPPQSQCHEEEPSYE